MLFMWFGARKCSFRFRLDSDFVGVCDLSNKYIPFPLLPALCGGQGGGPAATLGGLIQKTHVRKVKQEMRLNIEQVAGR